MARGIGVATFAGTDTAAFTWVDEITLAPLVFAGAPAVLFTGVTTTDGTVQAASLQNPPSASGGTVNTLGAFNGTVTVFAAG